MRHYQLRISLVVGPEVVFILLYLAVIVAYYVPLLNFMRLL